MPRVAEDGYQDNSDNQFAYHYHYTQSTCIARPTYISFIIIIIPVILYFGYISILEEGVILLLTFMEPCKWLTAY